METKITVTSGISFNGRSYKNVEDMPADERALFEQAMKALGKPGDGSTVGVRTFTSSRFVINGKEYDSPDEMPPEIRAIHDRVMADHAGTTRRRTAAGVFMACAGLLLVLWLILIVMRRLAAGP